jgi:hypothetical protein
MTKKPRRLSILNYFFLSSASLALLFILTEYAVSQKKTDLLKIEESHLQQRLNSIHKNKNSTPQEMFMYPPPWKLIDLKIQYIINSLVCHMRNETDNGSSQPISMIILITSHAGDAEQRNHLRRILPQRELNKIHMRRLFLLAKPNPKQNLHGKYSAVTIEEVFKEGQDHRDILMGDFFENYRNLTYKHLMGLQWAAKYCMQATYVLKQDDDIFVDFYQLHDIMKSTEQFVHLQTKNLIWGKVLSNQKVVRDPQSKWFVPETEISSTMEYYPPFVSGWGYITTPKVAHDIVNSADSEKYFWIDDAHLTGILREKTTTGLLDNSEYFTIFKGQLQCCIASNHIKAVDRNRPFWCDYLIGPTNGDLELMEILQRHSRFCHITHTCGRRNHLRRLKNTCIVTNNMVVNNFNSTVPDVRVKTNARGSYKSVKL